jgi:transcriptional regulator with XRE-family HTH domain
MKNISLEAKMLSSIITKGGYSTENLVILNRNSLRGMTMRDPQQMYAQIWSLLLDKIKERASRPGYTPTRVARELNVTPSTVLRWIEGTSGGENVGLKNILNMLQFFGVSFDEILKAAYPDEAEIVLPVLHSDPEMLTDLSKVVTSDDEDWKEKVRHDLKYAAKKAINQD